MRGRRVLGVGAVTAVLLAGMPAAAGHARTAAGERYVALGDSFTAGPLIPRQTGTPVGCLRSNRNYPSLVAARLRLRLTDVSCTSARIRNLTAPQRTPLGINPPQLNALTRNTALVTVGIGGNDAGFAEILAACGLASTTNPLGAPCAQRYADVYSERPDKVRPLLDGALRRIRARAPRARIMVVGYLRLLPDAPGCWPAVPVARGDLAFLNRLHRDLNRVLAERARAHGADFVDAYEGGEGHDMCAPAGRRWVEGILPSNAAAPVHPNAAGMREVADRVVDVLARSRLDSSRLA
ncbi:lipase [Actinomadura sp. NBRC 104425]|uniref:SGNH/GDSL hydrolase family protein n=1 Tax=Actinomadura sp. NBRC 104425 TaxID=3032204 RepID=UPI0024A321AF|nr:SGNH/GDSL hydrolase family protein [Actinomadura sp. NBRC 104425]GLZ15239.1 lipase [Actinomadura sp. NBRC 104425]